jgi:ATP sulfurylase
MKFENIKFNETTMPQGIQALVKFKDYELSIVKNDVSYGGKNGLYEIMVTKNDNQIELPGITEVGDSVKGFLNESEVEGIIKKMHLMSGADPEVA